MFFFNAAAEAFFPGNTHAQTMERKGAKGAMKPKIGKARLPPTRIHVAGRDGINGPFAPAVLSA
jgi:hypothetical protein